MYLMSSEYIGFCWLYAHVVLVQLVALQHPSVIVIVIIMSSLTIFAFVISVERRRPDGWSDAHWSTLVNR